MFRISADKNSMIAWSSGAVRTTGMAVCLLPLLWGATSRESASSAYLCDVYGAAEGLPENTVASLTRTSDGYLWAATQGGLARFDGLRFQTFHMLDSPGLPHDNIHFVEGARDGSLWIGTYNRGVAHLVHGRFEPVPGLLSPVIRAILEDRAGAIWIGTRGGLNRWKNGAISAYTQNDGLPAGDVLALAEDRQGRLWIGSSAGLSLIEQGKLTGFRGQSRLAGMDVRSFALAGDGSLWAASSQALARFKDGAVEEWYPRERLPFKGEIRAIAESADGALWIGTFGDGLLRFAGGRFERFPTGQGLASAIVFCLRADPDGSLWMGTSGSGLNRLRPRNIRMIGAPEGLSAADANAVLETRDGALWIATLGQGLNRYQDGRLRTFTTADGLSSDAVLSLWQSARTGKLWVGTGDGALNRLDGGRFRSIPLGAGKMPAQIFETREGEMWVGTTRGLYRLQDNSIERLYTTRDGLPSNTVLAITQARDGSLWMGTGSGLSHFRQGRFTNYETAKERNGYGPRVDWVYEDAMGTLWLGSAGYGLGRLREGKVFWAGKQQGLNDNVVYSGLEHGGDLWLSTNRGIGRVSKAQFEALAEGRISRMSVHVYDTTDGLRSNECSGDTQPSAWKRDTGELVFACLGGAVLLDPARLPREGGAPATLIEAAKISGQAALPQAGEQRFPPGDGRIEFTYTAIDFVAPRQLQFHYWLDGIDSSWVDAGARRTADYTNIPPGKYRFHVVSENADGLTSEAAMAFVMLPHFYQTVPFRLAVLGVATLLLAAAYRWKTRRARARRQELERLVEVRTQETNLAKNEAVAASRAKSQFLANMSHEIRTPMNGVLGMIALTLDSELNQDQKLYLEMAHSSATALLGLIDNILDFSKIEAGKIELDSLEFSLPEFLEEMTRIHAVRAYQKNLELVLDIAPEVPPLVAADRLRLGQVLTNLIGNALKFTERGEVVVSTSVGGVEGDQRNVCFSVRDTGIGMAPKTVERIFQPFSQADASTTRRFGGTGLGLTISAGFVRMMGGRMWVESREGEGSTFYFRVPIAAVEETAGNSWLAAGPLASENRRVLVADDNRTCRKVLAGLLRRWGLEAAEAADGTEALALLRAAAPGTFFTVLLDAEMPGVSGWEVAGKIAAEPLAPRIIVMTPILAQRHEAPGGAAVLTKPVRGRDLWQALGLGRSRQETATGGSTDGAPANPGITLPERRSRGLRILVAEDNPVNQLFARRLLEKKGHCVALVGDGEAALLAMEQESFDIVLMDVQMPVMDGLEAARRVRQRERQSASHIPIIAMTAHAMSGDRDVCLAAGMDGYVSKPVNQRELFAAIQAAADTLPGTNGQPVAHSPATPGEGG
ncbi:MAG TPA: two-component regulator propeller domain-containing protein [Bryobacteraceae bacterium]|nr:two-component regulator propeller domain-containing protein [Bryobacteraceae bacterium]